MQSQGMTDKQCFLLIWIISEKLLIAFNFLFKKLIKPSQEPNMRLWEGFNMHL